MELLMDKFYRNTKFYNIDRYVDGTKKVLFIVGFAGSGKSTLAKGLSKYYECSCYTTDGVIDELKEVKGIEFVKELKKDWKRLNNYIIQYLMEINKDKDRIIIEGGRIASIDMEIYDGYPLIIMGSGIVRSTLNAMKRNFTKEHWEKYRNINPLIFIRWNKRIYRELKELKRYMDNGR